MRCEGKRCPADRSKALLVGERLPSVSISADENRHDSSATRLFGFVSELGSILITTYYYSSDRLPTFQSVTPSPSPLAAFWLFLLQCISCFSHQIILIFLIRKKRSNHSAQLESIFVLLVDVIQTQRGHPRPTVWALLPVLWQLSPSGSSAHPG